MSSFKYKEVLNVIYATRSMRSRVYVTDVCLSVRASVPLINSTVRHGLLLRPGAGNTYRSIAASSASSVVLRAQPKRRTRLNTDLFLLKS